MYKVIVRFVDLKDNNRLYQVGDIYKGTNLKRIEELSSTNNKRGVALIKEVVEESKEKPTEEKEVKKVKKASKKK